MAQKTAQKKVMRKLAQNLLNLDYDWAWSIMENIRRLAVTTAVSGSIWVVNKHRFPLSFGVAGEPREFTATIALNKARQAAFTGLPTKDIAEKIESGERPLELYGIRKEIYVPFPGGRPIYTAKGVLVGGAGFSELAGDSDDMFAFNGILQSGFLPQRNSEDDIAASRIHGVVDIIEYADPTDLESKKPS